MDRYNQARKGDLFDIVEVRVLLSEYFLILSTP